LLGAVILSLLSRYGNHILFNEQIVPQPTTKLPHTMKALQEEKPVFCILQHFHPEYQEVKQPDGAQQMYFTRLFFYADQF